MATSFHLSKGIQYIVEYRIIVVTALVKFPSTMLTEFPENRLKLMSASKIFIIVLVFLSVNPIVREVHIISG